MSPELGIIEGTITLVFKHFQAHFYLEQKNPTIYFLMKFAEYEYFEE